QEQLGRINGAQAAYSRARKRAETLVAKYPTRAVYRQDLARSYLSAGHVYANSGLPDAAETAYVEAQLLLEKLAEERTLLYEGLGLLTGVHTALIGLYVNSGRPEQAQKVLLKSIEALQKLDGAYPQVPYFSSWLAASQVRLADWYAQMGKLVEAEEA